MSVAIPILALLFGTGVGPKVTAPAPPRLAGTWAEIQVSSVWVELPVLGAQRARTIATVRLQVEQAGTELTLKETVCGLESDSSSDAIETRYPPAFQAALSGTVRHAQLLGPGPWQYRERGALRTAGVQLGELEPLPTRSDDPRVSDADHDGHPGLTVQIRGLVNGEVYVIQRGRSDLQADLRRPDRLEGKLTWASEQVVLGASHRYLSSPPSTRPNLDESFFRRRRVPAGASCGEIMAHRKQLLGL